MATKEIRLATFNVHSFYDAKGKSNNRRVKELIEVRRA